MAVLRAGVVLCLAARSGHLTAFGGRCVHGLPGAKFGGRGRRCKRNVYGAKEASAGTDGGDGDVGTAGPEPDLPSRMVVIVRFPSLNLEQLGPRPVPQSSVPVFAFGLPAWTCPWTDVTS